VVQVADADDVGERGGVADQVRVPRQVAVQQRQALPHGRDRALLLLRAQAAGA